MKKFLPKEEGYVDFRHLTPSSKKGKTEKKVFFGNLANDFCPSNLFLEKPINVLAVVFARPK